MTEPRFARVIVDRPVQGDRRFHYAIPQELQQTVKPGVRVQVPFGPQQVVGLVTALDPEAPVPVKRIRPVTAVMDDVPLLTPPLLSLLAWLQQRYLCRPDQAVAAMIPGAFSSELGPAVDEVVVLGVAAQTALDAASELKPRAPQQAAVLRFLAARAGAGRGGLQLTELARQAGTSTSPIRALEEKGLVRREAVRRWRHEGGETAGPTESRLVLTGEQQQAWQHMEEAISAHLPRVLLLEGVTGSGKTELYLRAASQVLAQGRQVLVMVPEIALSPQMVRRFRRRLGDPLAVLHSAMSLGQRYDAWVRIRRGEVPVAIGARSAIFAPFPSLGLVVIDEEHEDSYKQEEAPCYDARDVALRRAAWEDALVVLGSATPRLASVHAAATERFTHLRLRQRVGGGQVPGVTVVDMRKELAQGRLGLFSRQLLEAAQRALDAGEQVLLFLNRRGFANFVFCRLCGEAVGCDACSVTLTLHKTEPPLWCHHCGVRRPLPRVCSNCGEAGSLEPWGSGTQQVAEAAQAAFPRARILRMDRDSTQRRGSHRRIYRAFRQREADILVGTQMIAKGWDIPRVTVAGVVLADTTLNLPDYRAAERTFQLVTQVVGRTGRSSRGGEAVVQTYQPEHPAIAMAATGEAGAFYERELAHRRQQQLPPFAHLVRLLVSGEDEGAVMAHMEGMAAECDSATPAGVTRLGPAPAAIRRRRGRYRWHLALRGVNMQTLQATARELAAYHEGAGAEGLRLRIDVGPVNMW